jgi:hypothetical protein
MASVFLVSATILTLAFLILLRNIRNIKLKKLDELVDCTNKCIEAQHALVHHYGASVDARLKEGLDLEKERELELIFGDLARKMHALTGSYFEHLLPDCDAFITACVKPFECICKFRNIDKPTIEETKRLMDLFCETTKLGDMFKAKIYFKRARITLIPWD